MNTVVLFGASGFIGRNLVDALVARGVEVIAVSKSGAAVSGASRCLAMAEVEGLKVDAKATAVFSVAAIRYAPASFVEDQVLILKANMKITQQVFDFCFSKGITEVRQASSAAVYPAGLALMEDAAPLDLNAMPNPGEAFYGWSKRWAEITARLYAERFGVSTLSFRLSNPYGPYDSVTFDSAHVAAAFVLRALAAGDTFELRGETVERDFIFASDVADAFVRSLESRGLTEAYNLASGTGTSLRTLAETTLRAADSGKRIVMAGEPSTGPNTRRMTADKVRTALGLAPPISLDEGLKRTVAWYRNALSNAVAAR